MFYLDTPSIQSIHQHHGEYTIRYYQSFMELNRHKITMKEHYIAYAFHYCLVGNVFLVVENSEVRRRKKKKYGISNTWIYKNINTWYSWIWWKLVPLCSILHHIDSPCRKNLKINRFICHHHNSSIFIWCIQVQLARA